LFDQLNYSIISDLNFFSSGIVNVSITCIMLEVETETFPSVPLQTLIMFNRLW